MIVTVIHINKKKQKKIEWRAKNKQLFIKTSAWKLRQALNDVDQFFSIDLNGPNSVVSL